jgi:phenylalanyl-tRNA synthetase beta chain
MLISWNWLKQYVPLTMSPRDLEERLMMAGLNHEETHEVGDDLCIDLEVTSNRPDCLGHIGIAREVSVLWQSPLTIPAARPAEGKTRAEELVRVRIDCPDLCPRYTARVIRGVRVGPSPDWLAQRLATVGIATINNVVDVSNYVMMECGQPLHTFDYAKLQGPEIIVRRPLGGETIEAIDHKTYRLESEMCVIADGSRAVAIAGVMGGAATEVNEQTRDVLIEAADFDPISVRTTARHLGLHSDSSYRFERRVDPAGIDWASRRCAELILEVAGGELAAGSVDVGVRPPEREPIVLRLSQIKRVLGIEIEPEVVRRILTTLGNSENAISIPPNNQRPHRPMPSSAGLVAFTPPSWRRDLSREIDLIEEVARIHGYDKIPEDVSVPMAASSRPREDRVVAKIRNVLTSAGFDEAMTLSAVDERSARAVQTWTHGEPLRSLTPIIRGADHLRTSLVPSLLASRRTNESVANQVIELFEIAKIYLPSEGLPEEWWMLGLTSGRPFAEVRGVVEAIVAGLAPEFDLSAEAADMPHLDGQAAVRWTLDGKLLGYAGQLSHEAVKQNDLRGPCIVAELKLAPLVERAELIPQYAPLPAVPAVARDLNLVVGESVHWAQIAATVRAYGGNELEAVEYRDTYRDSERLGGGKKSLLFSISLRGASGTLTSQQADGIRDRIVAACRAEHGAELRA